MFLIEMPWRGLSWRRNGSFYRIFDRAEVGRRVQVVNSRPALIVVDASRVSDAAPFGECPLQSDYQERWRRSHGRGAQPRPFEHGGAVIEFFRHWKRARRFSLRNRRFFDPLDPATEPG
jgi:hypothetical protein